MLCLWFVCFSGCFISRHTLHSAQVMKTQFLGNSPPFSCSHRLQLPERWELSGGKGCCWHTGIPPWGTPVKLGKVHGALCTPSLSGLGDKMLFNDSFSQIYISIRIMQILLSSICSISLPRARKYRGGLETSMDMGKSPGTPRSTASSAIASVKRGPCSSLAISKSSTTCRFG